jgi:hypothetical protein
MRRGIPALTDVRLAVAGAFNCAAAPSLAVTSVKLLTSKWRFTVLGSMLTCDRTAGIVGRNMRTSLPRYIRVTKRQGLP